MLDIIIKEHKDHSDRDLLLKILGNQYFIISKLAVMSNDAQDLQGLIDQLKQSQAATKLSLDAANKSLGDIKTGIGTIIKGIPTGGLTAEETANLKASLSDALTGEQANQAEAEGTASAASDDAAAVASAQPAPETPAA
jgi:hypothetical protein